MDQGILGRNVRVHSESGSWPASQRPKGRVEVQGRGGSEPFSSSLDLRSWLHPVVTTRMGGSCTQGGKPGGRSKTQQARSLLRTAAMDCQDHPEPGLPHPIAKLFGDGLSLRAEVPTEKVMAGDAARRIFPKPQAGQPLWQNQKSLTPPPRVVSGCKALADRDSSPKRSSAARAALDRIGTHHLKASACQPLLLN